MQIYFGNEPRGTWVGNVVGNGCIFKKDPNRFENVFGPNRFESFLKWKKIAK